MIRRARHQPIRKENYARARAKRPWLIPIVSIPTGAMVKHERRYDGLRTEELEDFYMSTKKWLRWPTGCDTRRHTLGPQPPTTTKTTTIKTTTTPQVTGIIQIPKGWSEN